MQGEYQAQGTQSLLPARQLVDLLPRLLRRSHTEVHPVAERVQRVDQLHFCVPAVSQKLVDLLEFRVDEGKNLAEHLEALFFEFVDGFFELQLFLFDLVELLEFLLVVHELALIL